MRVAAGATPEEMQGIFALWLKGAEQGDAKAQRMVGDFYLRGVGVERSSSEARRWLKAAADQGNAPAMVLLGGLLLQPPGDSTDATEAVSLFQRAAAQGNADAAYNLGVCLERGLGVAANSSAAEQSYRSAAQGNHVLAQVALGDLLAARDAADAGPEAARWYRFAADVGSSEATYRLGQLHESGRGVTRDRAAAVAYFRRAAAAGHVEARAALQRLETGAP